MNTILVVFLLAIFFAILPMSLLFLLKDIKHIKIAFSVLLAFYCVALSIGVFARVQIGEDVVISFYKINKDVERFFNFSIITRNLQDILINILMFIPFGFYISALFKKWAVLKTVAIGGLTSILIETIQYFLPGVRSAQLADIILNTASCLIGAVAFFLIYKIRKVIRHE